MATQRPTAPAKGRGATFNPDNRFRRDTREAYDDGYVRDDEVDAPPRLKTTVTVQLSRTIISRNDSPDVGFTQSINPYQGCEHGCIYCYARPSHAYLDLSPGLDFETKLFAKPNASALLRSELAHPKYVCDPIALGANTDPYQPIEREWKVTRSILEVLSQCRHPFSIVTKSSLVERDIDLIAPMARESMARVFVSITTLDHDLARKLEPRATAPARRLQTVKALSDAGIPVGVLVAPIIPQLNDRDMESILEAAAANGARWAGWILVRLPHEIAPLFRDWLATHYPLRAAHVMSIIQQLRGGRDNDPRFGSRMTGSGEFSALLEKRFSIAVKRLGLNRDRAQLDATKFVPPAPPTARRRDADSRQLDLF